MTQVKEDFSQLQPERLEHAIAAAQNWLLKRQACDGHWCAELEGDTILESEYALVLHFLGILEPEKLRKLANYVVKQARPQGGWSIYPGGPMELSASVKAYMVLKLAGHPPDGPVMQKAREAILNAGGVTKTNTFTKFYLAMVGLYDWDGVPTIPAELILLPRWFMFSIYNMSAWSRTMIVPLSILRHYQPVRPFPNGFNIDELFVGGRQNADLRLPRDKKFFTWRNVFLAADEVLRFIERHGFTPLRKIALKRAEKWMIARFEKSDGLGAIFPAMCNSLMVLDVLGYPRDGTLWRNALREIELLEIEEGDALRLQPCFSPVWDTAISTIALRDSGLPADHPALVKAARWLLQKEVRTLGDWRFHHANGRNYRQGEPIGAWFFEHENEFYPDVDDTVMVIMALDRVRTPFEDEKQAAIRRGIDWVVGMQGHDDGWAAFDRDNNTWLFTQVPFADHNAMIDPSTADITARVLEMLSRFGFDPQDRTVARALKFVRKNQETDGSWYGRWGCNYIYGTWQVLKGLSAIGEDLSAPYVRRAVSWLKSVQNADGGWGETCRSYDDAKLKAIGPSTASQTAWAVIGLLAAGEPYSFSVARGAKFLVDTQTADGTWDETQFTGTGFPNVFYLRYHYYRHYFPLLALGQYARAIRSAKPIEKMPRTIGVRRRKLLRQVVRIRNLARL
jgi:squalene-hopene/tetraprenyl-beta-curcumene cyclase